MTDGVDAHDASAAPPSEPADPPANPTSDQPTVTATEPTPSQEAANDGDSQASERSSAAGAHRSTARARRRIPGWLEMVGLVVIALLVAVGVKTFLVQIFWIPSGSMQNTLAINDRVAVDRLSYRLHAVHRGDIVVFNGAGSWDPVATGSTNAIASIFGDLRSAFGLTPPGSTDYIKRVIGVAGDTVQCCDTRGRVEVNGVPLTEPYLFQDDHMHFGPIKVPANSLWVMGDHRGYSYDSRQRTEDPGGGSIPVSAVIGRAIAIIWPPSHWATLSSGSTFANPAISANNSATASALSGHSNALPGAAAAVVVTPIGLVRWRRRRRGRERS